MYKSCTLYDSHYMAFCEKQALEAVILLIAMLGDMKGGINRTRRAQGIFRE